MTIDQFLIDKGEKITCELKYKDNSIYGIPEWAPIVQCRNDAVVLFPDNRAYCIRHAIQFVESELQILQQNHGRYDHLGSGPGSAGAIIHYLHTNEQMSYLNTILRDLQELN